MFPAPSIRLTRSRRRRLNAVGQPKRTCAFGCGLNNKTSSQRVGYTLMELLLVLAIIVIAAAAVTPRMTGLMRNVSLTSAANTVRAELTKAHVTAMRTGRVQVFNYELGGRKYKVEPWIAGDDMIENATGEENTAPPAAAKSLHEPMIPEGTKFASGDSAAESRSEKIAQEMQGDATWSRPIMFYPDGSAGDAYIVVGNDHNAGIRINLRGMTAAVTVEEIKDLKLLEEDTTVSK
jgi:prepilin-type N-terminal cleavage/methylation domain-containing protein